ncbi:MAG: phosphatidylglycerophosphatase A [Proteobacteria bacterium]|nr:phosphatidylglycerophosphatase A [Pseudomonadota bacterium]
MTSDIGNDNTRHSKIAKQIATVFGLGSVFPAPGTAASAVALPIAWLIVHLGTAPWQGRGYLLLAGLIVFAVGAWASELYARAESRTDPSECVIDEIAGQWVACAFAPVSLLGFAIAFFLFRAFDITKLWPVNLAERLSGGLGIMLDDIVAGVMAGAVIAVLVHTGIL